MTREQALNWRWETDHEPWIMRGSAAQTAAQNQLKTTNAAAAQQGQTANALENQTLIPEYQNLLTEGFPGYNAGEAANIMGAAVGPIGAAFGSEEQQARNEASATRNAATLPAEEEALALEKGNAASQAALGAENEIANTALQNRIRGQEFGAQGLEQLYGTNTQAMESLYGMAPGTINAWTNAQAVANQPPGWLSWLGPAIGAGGQLGAAAINKGGGSNG